VTDESTSGNRWEPAQLPPGGGHSTEATGPTGATGAIGQPPGKPIPGPVPDEAADLERPSGLTATARRRTRQKGRLLAGAAAAVFMVAGAGGFVAGHATTGGGEGGHDVGQFQESDDGTGSDQNHAPGQPGGQPSGQPGQAPGLPTQLGEHDDSGSDT